MGSRFKFSRLAEVILRGPVGDLISTRLKTSRNILEAVFPVLPKF